jgi:hypothetical protein
MFGGEQNGRPRTPLYIIGIVVTGLAFIFFALAGIGALLAGVHVTHSSSVSQGASGIWAALIFFVLAAICARLAIEFEHRFRGLPTGRIRLGGRYGPHSHLTAGIVIGVLGIFLIIAAFASNSDADKSIYTQSHGIQTTATVQNVTTNQNTNCTHSNTSYCRTTYTAQVTATLKQPVGGQTATTVNIPNRVSYSAGQVITVLVDPKDPGYSELPGSPYATKGGTVIIVVFVVLLLAIGTAAIVRAVRMRQRGHSYRAMEPAGMD